MNISDDFLSSHNFMTLPPQNNALPQIYDFLQICAVRCLGAMNVRGFQDQVFEWEVSPIRMELNVS